MRALGDRCIAESQGIGDNVVADGSVPQHIISILIVDLRVTYPKRIFP